MPCTEAYREHIMYTFNGYCKTVIRFAAINAWRDRSRRRQKEISLEYLTEEKFYPL
ncbi:MAG: sigma-70 family RNA polymerase sigma factor, partial [Lachnospiraceae bacterium]|nr:sigma-70 family RNA polymerase sigma factor [Lachnospiraceae bacterium]